MECDYVKRGKNVFEIIVILFIYIYLGDTLRT